MMRKILSKSKKADENSLEKLIFIILNCIFFAVLFFFVYRNASSDSLAEEVYAKKIALLIDSMKPGTEIHISINYLYDLAKANKYSGIPVRVDDTSKKVFVIVKGGTGYSFGYFNNIKESYIPEDREVLVIKA